MSTSVDPEYVIRPDGTLMRADEIEREERVSVENPPDTHRAVILSAEIEHTKGTIRKYEDEIRELEYRVENKIMARGWDSEDERRSAIQEGIDVTRRTIAELRAEIAVKQAEYERITAA